MSETIITPIRTPGTPDHPPGEPTGQARPGSFLWKMLTTTDHKMLGIMYIVTCFIFFFIGGLMALLIRAELFFPGMQFLSNEQFNQLFTMHGTVMLLLYGTPIVVGLGELLWDCFGDSRRPGGAPANVAFQANQLGCQGVVCSRVGDDRLGRELIRFLEQQGLETGWVQRDSRHPTGGATASVSFRQRARASNETAAKVRLAAARGRRHGVPIPPGHTRCSSWRASRRSRRQGPSGRRALWRAGRPKSIRTSRSCSSPASLPLH